MNAQKIIFATDFSPGSQTTLAVASSLAKSTGAELLIVHCTVPPAVYGGAEMVTHLGEMDEKLSRERLAAITPHDPAVRVRRELLHGDPAKEVVDLARREKADLIVVGSHGRTGLERLLMGSVAESIVRRASCPVLTIKPQKVVGSPPAKQPK
jgi:nucleotide-binding universal stress UspA family protein